MDTKGILSARFPHVNGRASGYWIQTAIFLSSRARKLVQDIGRRMNARRVFRGRKERVCECPRMVDNLAMTMAAWTGMSLVSGMRRVHPQEDSGVGDPTAKGKPGVVQGHVRESGLTQQGFVLLRGEQREQVTDALACGDRILALNAGGGSKRRVA